MYVFHVADMSCGNCVGRITRAILAEDATARVEADLVARRLSVETTEAAEDVLHLLGDIGYEATLA